MRKHGGQSHRDLQNESNPLMIERISKFVPMETKCSINESGFAENVRHLSPSTRDIGTSLARRASNIRPRTLNLVCLYTSPAKHCRRRPLPLITTRLRNTHRGSQAEALQGCIPHRLVLLLERHVHLHHDRWVIKTLPLQRTWRRRSSSRREKVPQQPELP